jgi:hypothetical protein
MYLGLGNLFEDMHLGDKGSGRMILKWVLM